MTNNETPKSLTENSGQVPGDLPPKQLHVIMARAGKGKSMLSNEVLKQTTTNVIGAEINTRLNS
jgi:hypothetical protein